ncbi:MAG: hypothetical protein ACLR4Z_05485 [Butyricicoccaceae bacterium]
MPQVYQNELLMHFRRKRRTAGEVSLSDTLETDGDGNALSLQDTISCEDEGLNAVDDHDRYYSMYRALFSSLSLREREVIRLRYGLGAAAPLPQHASPAAATCLAAISPYRKASPRESCAAPSARCLHKKSCCSEKNLTPGCGCAIIMKSRRRQAFSRIV